MRIMALDLGKVRSGVAVSDPTRTIAQPLTTLDSRDKDRLFDELLSMVQEGDVERVVVGIPRALDGRRGPMAYWAEGIRRELASHLPIPVEAWDERFSTASAIRILRFPQMSDSGSRPGEDSVAAAIILENYLEYLRLQRERP